MNALQSAKYALVKAQLKAISFDWIDSPNYSRNGETVYQAEEVVYSPVLVAIGRLYLSPLASCALIVVTNQSPSISCQNTTHKNTS